jgi:hypothetical protein
MPPDIHVIRATVEVVLVGQITTFWLLGLLGLCKALATSLSLRGPAHPGLLACAGSTAEADGESEKDLQTCGCWMELLFGRNCTGTKLRA